MAQVCPDQSRPLFYEALPYSVNCPTARCHRLHWGNEHTVVGYCIHDHPVHSFHRDVRVGYDPVHERVSPDV